MPVSLPFYNFSEFGSAELGRPSSVSEIYESGKMQGRHAGKAEYARLLKENPGTKQDLGLRGTSHCCGSSCCRAICNREDKSEIFIGMGLFEKSSLRGSEEWTSSREISLAGEESNGVTSIRANRAEPASQAHIFPSGLPCPGFILRWDKYCLFSIPLLIP